MKQYFAETLVQYSIIYIYTHINILRKMVRNETRDYFFDFLPYDILRRRVKSSFHKIRTPTYDMWYKEEKKRKEKIKKKS